MSLNLISLEKSDRQILGGKGVPTDHLLADTMGETDQTSGKHIFLPSRPCLLLLVVSVAVFVVLCV